MRAPAYLLKVGGKIESSFQHALIDTHNDHPHELPQCCDPVLRVFLNGHGFVDQVGPVHLVDRMGQLGLADGGSGQVVSGSSVSFAGYQAGVREAQFPSRGIAAFPVPCAIYYLAIFDVLVDVFQIRLNIDPVPSDRP